MDAAFYARDELDKYKDWKKAPISILHCALAVTSEEELEKHGLSYEKVNQAYLKR